MDAHVVRQIQREGAEALLNVGVSLPLLDVRVPFRKEPLHLRVTMSRPTLARQIEIARTWLSVGMTLEEFCAMDFDAQMAFKVRHGQQLARMIALTLDGGGLPRWALTWLVCHRMKWEYQKAALEKFIALMGTDSFIPIIRLAESVNPMKLRLSRERKGS